MLAIFEGYEATKFGVPPNSALEEGGSERSCRIPHLKGFTLIEVILIMVIVGILAVYRDAKN